MKTKEEVIAFLNSYSNNSFRKETENEEAYIYDAQIDAAKEVVSELASNRTRSNHVILVAKMQSGKTGTCNAITNMVMSTSLKRDMAIKRVLYITGMNDCGLVSQTYSRIIEQVILANEDNTTDCSKSKSTQANSPKFFVLKNSNLKNYEHDLNGTLIFIDEAHFGSKERNVLTKFMLAKGIDWKNQLDLIRNNVYIVSVSATPFDEIISDTIDSKPMVELKTNDSYIGVSEYIEKGLVHSATKDDIADGTIFDYIEDAYERMEENSEKGIIIVRTRNFEPFHQNKFITDNFDIHEMYASGTKIEYDKLNDIMNEMVAKNNSNNRLYYRANMDSRVTAEPTEVKPLIVLIKGAFRAGITIEAEAKDLIYMVYDFSAGADTTAQALLGRMCGYRDLEHSVFNTHFYVNTVFAQMYADWENDFRNKDLVPCSKTKWTWVDNDYQGMDIKFGTKPCGNFAINLSNEDVRWIYQTCGQKKQQNAAAERILPQILSKYGKNIHYDYFIEAYMSGKNKYAKSTQEKRFNSFSEDSLVFQILPDKNKNFQEQTGRTTFNREDLGKKAVGIVFDATIEIVNGRIVFGGNKRLLVYYVEVGQKKRMANRQTQYQAHKDTALTTN